MDIFERQIEKLKQHNWNLYYDEETHTAKMINETGEEMDLQAFQYCIEALKNRAYDLHETKFGQEKKHPYDEVSRRRHDVMDYKLITEETRGNIKNIFEVYSDIAGLFVLDNFSVYSNRKTYENGYLVYLNSFEAKEVLESLSLFVEKHKDE